MFSKAISYCVHWFQYFSDDWLTDWQRDKQTDGLTPLCGCGVILYTYLCIAVGDGWIWRGIADIINESHSHSHPTLSLTDSPWSESVISLPLSCTSDIMSNSNCNWRAYSSSYGGRSVVERTDTVILKDPKGHIYTRVWQRCPYSRNLVSDL